MKWRHNQNAKTACFPCEKKSERARTRGKKSSSNTKCRRQRYSNCGIKKQRTNKLTYILIFYFHVDACTSALPKCCIFIYLGFVFSLNLFQNIFWDFFSFASWCVNTFRTHLHSSILCFYNLIAISIFVLTNQEDEHVCYVFSVHCWKLSLADCRLPIFTVTIRGTLI